MFQENTTLLLQAAALAQTYTFGEKFAYGEKFLCGKVSFNSKSKNVSAIKWHFEEVVLI